MIGTVMREFLESIREYGYKKYLQTLSMEELLEEYYKQPNVFRIRELIMDRLNKKESGEG